MSRLLTTPYSASEEALNVSTHAVGFVLSLVALLALLVQSTATGDVWTILSFSIFGVSLIITYAVSTIYHSSVAPLRRSRLRIMDHASIYVLIAGTYTPLTIVTLQGVVGWTIFGISWAMAVVGIVLKLFYTGRYSRLSTLMYIAMRWMIVFAIMPLKENLPAPGLAWLIAGGVSYTIGAVLYGIKKIPFNHAIFHVFTLMGSICHFFAVYLYVR